MSKEVLEFVIVPPYPKRDAIGASKERLSAYLEHRFPGYTFKVGPFVPVGNDDEFMVLPVMNYVGDDGKSHLCDEPRRWFLQEIAEACAAFDADGRRSFAA